MAAARTPSETALKLFEGFSMKNDLVRVYLEAVNDFTVEELKEYRKLL